MRGEHRLDAGQGTRGACVDGNNTRVRVRAAQEGRVQHPLDTHIIDKTPAAGEQRRILDTAGAGADHAQWRSLFGAKAHFAFPALPALSCTAASIAAATMFWYPVQRHKWPESTSRTSASVGDAFVSSSSVSETSTPGVQ